MNVFLYSHVLLKTECTFMLHRNPITKMEPENLKPGSITIQCRQSLYRSIPNWDQKPEFFSNVLVKIS